MPYVEVLKKYAQFSGRAKRSEFWWFVLVHVIVFATLFMGAAITSGSWWAFTMLLVYAVGTILPYWAVTVRRLHDVGYSGWWLLVQYVPLGFLVLLIMLVSRSDGDNKFGSATPRFNKFGEPWEDPKAPR